jgi:hypothetical protein
MPNSPSPIERILKLEAELDRLRQQLDHETAEVDDSPRVSVSRAIWQADEILLTRLIRRSPEAISAYRAAAELTTSSDGNLRLTSAITNSPFWFCELSNGDATVWLTAAPPDWIWNTDVLQHLFIIHEASSIMENLVLQRLPIFKPVVRGRDWSLFQPGEMIPRGRRFQVAQEQALLVRRLETIERDFRQQTVKRDQEFARLQTMLLVQQDLINRLCQVRGVVL